MRVTSFFDDAARSPAREQAGEEGAGWAAPGKLSLLDGAAQGLRVAAAGVPGRQTAHQAQAQVALPGGGGGRAAPEGVRARVEGVTGADLSGVRIHDGGAAAAAAAGLGARAFTIGSDVYFGAGELRPGSADGDHLIAHELGHAAQQHSGGGGLTAQAKLMIGGEHDPAEREADAIADAAVARGSGPGLAAARGPSAARVAATASAPALRMVRMTGEQGGGFVRFDNTLSSTVYFPAKGLHQTGTADDVLDALEKQIGAIELLLKTLDQLTQDESDPDSNKGPSLQVGQTIGGLAAPLDSAARALEQLGGTISTGQRGKSVLAAVDRIGELSAQIRDRANRAVRLHERSEKKRVNDEAHQKVSTAAKGEFKDHHGTPYEEGVQLASGMKISLPVGSIDESLQRLADTGRLAEIVTALEELFAAHHDKKAESKFHKDFFGSFGGKDQLDRLIANALHNLAHPETIFQGKTSTCAAAVLEMMLAINEPAKYLRMLREVASGKAEVALKDSTIKPTGKPGHDNETLRNPASHLMQPALMEAMRPGEQYDAKSDRFLKSKGTDDKGVADADLVHGSEQVLASGLTKGTKSNGAQLGSTEPRAATIRHRGKSHQILVISDDSDFVYFLNPQYGRPEKMAQKEWRTMEVQMFDNTGEVGNLAAYQKILTTDKTLTWTLITPDQVMQ